MAERWLPVVGYEGVYEVSDLGRVLSYARGAPRILKPGRRPDGHLTVSLLRGNTRQVHQLVMEAFVGRPPPRHEVRHLDGDPGANELSNLAYATRSRNGQDRKWHKGPNPGNHKLLPEQARDIKRRLPLQSDAALARDFGVSRKAIWNIRNGHFHVDVAA